MHTLFVCLGNICRSPLAAGVMRRYFDLYGINSMVESAGLADWNVGNSADRRAVMIARAHNIDLSDHVARQLCLADFDRFEMIYVMDKQNLRAIKTIAPERLRSSIRMLAGDSEIPDPYHADDAAFRKVFSMIDDCCRSIVENELCRR
jgi:protein-tyrosine phosphatase